MSKRIPAHAAKMIIHRATSSGFWYRWISGYALVSAWKLNKTHMYLFSYSKLPMNKTKLFTKLY